MKSKWESYFVEPGSRYSAVGIATDRGLYGRGVGFRVPVRERFSPLHVIQTGSGAHPVSNPISESKAAGAWSWPLTSSSAEVKNTLIYTFTSAYVFMA
jgi:hypothetical protein